MKICPFMSHMLGNEANVLEVGTAVDELGHDDSHGGVGGKTSARTGVKESKPAASHLYCLRDTCRFYRSKDGDCTFDAILELSLIHISEPTRLLRISYAVFCLKK